MAVSQTSSGTQTATLTTEHTLATVTTAGTYVLRVDANALVAGETLTLRINTEALSGGTRRIEHEAVFAGPLAEPMIVSIPVAIAHGVAFTLRQDGGTGRAYPWSVLRLDA
jgi:hypothetical protein